MIEVKLTRNSVVRYHDISTTCMKHMDVDIHVNIENIEIFGIYKKQYLIGRFIKTDSTSVSVEYFKLHTHFDEESETKKYIKLVEKLLFERKTFEDIHGAIKELLVYEIL